MKRLIELVVGLSSLFCFGKRWEIASLTKHG